MAEFFNVLVVAEEVITALEERSGERKRYADHLEGAAGDLFRELEQFPMLADALIVVIDKLTKFSIGAKNEIIDYAVEIALVDPRKEDPAVEIIRDLCSSLVETYPSLAYDSLERALEIIPLSRMPFKTKVQMMFDEVCIKASEKAVANFVRAVKGHGPERNGDPA